MLNWWKNRQSEQQSADRLYEAIVTQARTPQFYSHLNVPDTIDGRYELIVLHLFLVMERLRADDERTAGVARRTLERFVEDMDDCMREIGVSDLKVPKKVKEAASGFYDRAIMLRDALPDHAGAGETTAIVTDAAATPGRSDNAAMTDYFERIFADQHIETESTQDPATDENPAAQIDKRALARYAVAAAKAVSDNELDIMMDGRPGFPSPIELR
ncbi:MAG: ubiquinol-cytochrome C chaperone family protein [Pseudomonadota bacterium]